LSYAWRLRYWASYELIVLEGVDDAAVDVPIATGFGAAPVVRSDSPTEDSPPLGNDCDVSELDVPEDAGEEPMDEMPLIGRIYHFGAPICLGSKRA